MQSIAKYLRCVSVSNGTGTDRSYAAAARSVDWTQGQQLKQSDNRHAPSGNNYRKEIHGGDAMAKYKPTKFKLKTSRYDKEKADFAVEFIENLCHTKGIWYGKKFKLLDWQEQIIRDIFGTVKPDGYRQFN